MMHASGTTETEVSISGNGSAPSHASDKIAEIVGASGDEVGADDWDKAALSVVVVGASGTHCLAAACLSKARLRKG